MAEKEKRNFNIGAMMGQNLDDIEICEDLNLDLSFAYTPEINRAATEAVYKRNIADGMQLGESKEKAVSDAEIARSNTLKLYSSLLRIYPNGVSRS